MPMLIMTTAAGETRQVQLNPVDNEVGRGSTNDVIFDSAQASRDHALIAVEQAFVTITDLGSRNGTFANTSPVLANVSSPRSKPRERNADRCTDIKLERAEAAPRRRRLRRIAGATRLRIVSSCDSTPPGPAAGWPGNKRRHMTVSP